MEKSIRDMNPRELEEYVHLFDNAASLEVDAVAFSWEFVELSLSDVMKKSQRPSTLEDWKTFLKDEQSTRLEEWGYDSIQEIADYWLPKPEWEPIILFITEEGNYEFWDGYHRFAIAVSAGREIAPFLVGKLKDTSKTA